ncbi:MULTISPECIES: YcxB family protein [Kitasatospora]|uniref:YcxB-like protein domain-containing protein n=1 Tax=Kitasatospora cystarginea TaxID=58350 RepID=A0ABP5RXX8_9ACTN
MNIRVDYTAEPEDLAAAVRANFPSPPIRWAIAAAWILLSLACLAAGLVLFAIAALICGLLQIQNITIVTKKLAARAAQRSTGPTSVAMTDEELVIRTQSGEMRIAWQSILRVVENPLAWTLLAKWQGTAVSATVLKAAFTDAQTAEVTAAISRLTKAKFKIRQTRTTKVPAGAR